MVLLVGVALCYCMLLYAGIYNADGWGSKGGLAESQVFHASISNNQTTNFGPSCWPSSKKLNGAGLRVAFPASGTECSSVLPAELCGPEYQWLAGAHSAELSHTLHSCHSINTAGREQCCCVSARQGSASGLLYRCLPSVLIPGAPKAGTTALWNGLMQHPMSIRTKSNVKELGFFLKGANGGIGVRSLEVYLNMLVECPVRAPAPGYASEWVDECAEWATGHFSVDGSALYSTNMGALKRAAALLPNAMVVFLRRNPVDRTVSAVLQACRTWARMNVDASTPDAIHWMKMSVVSALEKDADVLASCTQFLCDDVNVGSGMFSQLLTSSCYGPQVRALQALFNNILILDFEDVTTHFSDALSTVYAHLGLPRVSKLDLATLDKLPADMGLDWTNPSTHVCLRIQQNITDLVHQYDKLLRQCD
jgi:hypothetical protein